MNSKTNDAMQDPNLLFDTIMTEMKLKNDAALGRLLGVQAPTISNMRRLKLKIGPSLILSILENTYISLPRVRRLLAGFKD